MARHSEDYYWSDEQKKWAKSFINKLNVSCSDYERKKKELLIERKKYIQQTLFASRTFRGYSQDLQTGIINSINDEFSRKIEQLDNEFFYPYPPREIEP